MSRYLGAFTDTDDQIYPPFINFTEVGPDVIRVIVRSPRVLAKLPGRGDELFPQTGNMASFDMKPEDLKLLLEEVLDKLEEE
jgi:hypothetical protein